MTNRVLMYILFGSLLGMLAGWALEVFQIYSSSFPLKNISESLFLLTGLYLLVKEGTFIHTSWFRFLGIGVALVLIGALFYALAKGSPTHWLWYGTVFLALFHTLCEKASQGLGRYWQIGISIDVFDGEILQAYALA